MARQELLSGKELPARAKPEVLFNVCKTLDETGRTLRSDLYSEMDADRRDISAACDYGELLKIVEQEDVGRNTPFVDIGEHGYGFTVADSFKSVTAQNVFKKAIQEYEPYLCILLFAHKLGITSDVNGDRVITKTDAKEALLTALDIDAEDRSINLFFKTVEAAGIGERIIGRRQFETRLVLKDGFNQYVNKLAEMYGDSYNFDEEVTDAQQNDLDVDVAKVIADEKGDQTTSESAQSGDTIGAQVSENGHSEEDTSGIIAHLKTEDVALSVEVDISGKSDEEVLEVINQIKALE